MEVSVEALTKDHPECFGEVLHYCKKLSFTQDPDYKFIIDQFTRTMQQHDINPNAPDFIWNKNRLVLEKEAIKA